MGCGCSSGGYTIASYIYMFERLASTVALTMIICCIVSITMGMLSLGIGLGYNYCFVDFKVKKLYETSNPRRSQPLIRKRKSIEDDKSFPNASVDGVFNIEPTMRIPLNSNISFSLLIHKLKELNKNITLELLAT